MRYLHGGDIYRNRNVELDFSVNVNPLGMPEFVRQAARESLNRCECYPDSECQELKQVMADYFRVSGEQILIGNGAAELIFRLVQALQPRRAVVLAPSFLEYARALESVECETCFFYLKEENGFEVPVREYLDFLNEKQPEIVFLCNPANPVGTVMGREAMEEILSCCAGLGCFVVVDECFQDFLESGERYSCLGQVRDGSRGLLVLQAFTKSFAMAGLRLGYGFLADMEMKERMERAGQPWSVSIPAQAAGVAAFGAGRERYLRETGELLKKEREFLWRGLTAAGFAVYGSRANFLFFKDRTGKTEYGLYEYFLERRILIRSCGNYEGLDGFFYRICVKKHEDNEKFLQILNGYL